MRKMGRYDRGALRRAICSLCVWSPLWAYSPSVQAQSVAHLEGEIEVAALPQSLLSGQFVSQARIRLLDEGTATVAAGMPAFAYDGAIHDPSRPVVSGDDTFGNALTAAYAGPGLPAVGTTVHAMLLHFDPNLAGLPFSLTQGIARSASITFDRPILGVYVTSQALIATDAIFAHGGVAYSTDAARDMEFNYDGDAYSVSPDRSTLSLTMYGHNGGRFDEARVVLAAAQPTEVPALPGLGWVILGMGLAVPLAMRLTGRGSAA